MTLKFFSRFLFITDTTMPAQNIYLHPHINMHIFTNMSPKPTNLRSSQARVTRVQSQVPPHIGIKINFMSKLLQTRMMFRGMLVGEGYMQLFLGPIVDYSCENEHEKKT